MKILKHKWLPNIGDRVEGVALDNKGIEHIFLTGVLMKLRKCPDPSCGNRLCLSRTYAEVSLDRSDGDYESGVCLYYIDRADPSCQQWRLRSVTKKDRRRPHTGSKIPATSSRRSVESKPEGKGQVA
jgi:hypothetical protein